tara:strand:+ start:3128 stop:4015 length:888 start_codon:yes stop_codon:yes gene_type:complete
MVECVDRVRKKVDKFLDLIYKSNPKNRFIKSDTVDINDKTPRVFRGVTRNKTIQQCINNDIDFYYIDTGYMGCYPDKNWHRFVKNNFQTLSHATYAELDFLCNMGILKKRFKDILGFDYDSYKPTAMKTGDTIMIIPPSEKVLRCFQEMGYLKFRQKDFIDHTIKEIKKHSDRKIIVRQKPNRDERVRSNRLLTQMKDDKVHCLVAFNSIAAFEAIQAGYPTITLCPNAANFLSDNNISNIEKPYFPDDEKIRQHSLYLTACQFNKDEFKSGFATKTIELVQGLEKHKAFSYELN